MRKVKEERMTYVISDIHGRYDKYSAMLEKINLGDNDTLYILGDAIDRGKNGIKILLDILRRPNAVMLMGNHEALMLDTLREFEQFNEEAIRQMELYILNGGAPTLTAFLEQCEADRMALWDFLEEMPLYKEIKVCDREFVLLHGGLENFSPDRALCDYSRDEILWARPDFNAEYFSDRYLIVGHTPVKEIWGKYKIFRNDKLIDIDCGCACEDGRLGCL